MQSLEIFQPTELDQSLNYKNPICATCKTNKIGYEFFNDVFEFYEELSDSISEKAKFESIFKILISFFALFFSFNMNL